MFQNIVVAFNGTEESKRALRSAVRLTKLTGAALHTVTVLSDLPAYTAYAIAAGTSTPAILKDSLYEAYARLEEEVRRTASEGGMSVATHAVEGRDVPSIIKFLSVVRADLLVIGIHKHQGHLSALWSTAHELAQRASCSVLGVP